MNRLNQQWIWFCFIFVIFPLFQDIPDVPFYLEVHSLYKSCVFDSVFLILTWSLHLTVLGYAVTMWSMISLCCLCFVYRLYTDLVSTPDCVGVRCDYLLCDIFMLSMLSLYCPGLYIWLCWCTLCQCSLCFLYTDLVSTLDCVGVRCDYVLCDIFMLSMLFYTDLVSTLNCVGVHCDYVLCDIFMLSMLSLYWPGLYTWLYWGTLWLCTLWYLYAVYALSIDSILTWSLHLTVLGYAVTMCSVISLCCLITALCRGLWPALSLASDNFSSSFSWTFVKSSWCTACIRLLILDWKILR